MKDMYEDVKTGIDRFILQQKNCCKIGCAFCCYQTIEVIDIEIDAIKDFLVNKIDEITKEKIKENLKEYFIFFNKNTPNNKILDEHDLINHFQDIANTSKCKCPLLIENKCSIYEGRPLACRIHVVEKNPEICEAEPYRDSAPLAINVRGSLLQYVLSKKKTYIIPLAYLIAEALMPEMELKPIKKLYMN
ncbi:MULTISPECIES: YkgJ family cysteine cluster protein [Flavobacterium]|nr:MULTISPECIES: YkgJ family cysteine cluster protein [Flavobacterium]